MKGRKTPEPNGRLIDVKNGMDALDVLDERLDRLLDRLNLLWDRVVGIEEEPLKDTDRPEDDP